MQHGSRLSLLIRVSACVLAAGIVYVLSFAPFLWAVSDPDDPGFVLYYRAPAVYRPVEWLIVKTPLQKPLLKWADCFGVQGVAEIQGWYFAQGVEDTSRFHFNIQN